MVRDSAEPWVALGSRLSAELYDCRVLASDVEDDPENLTRFVWLAREDDADDPAGRAKTSIVFWGAGDESPGWLVSVLSELAERSIRLWRDWNYAFGVPLYHEIGVMFVRQQEMAPSDFEYESFKILTERGHKIERMNSARRWKRFPAWNPDWRRCRVARTGRSP